MKKLLLPLVIAVSALSANAATIVLQSGSPAVDFKIAGGSNLPLAGSTVVLGFFRNYTPAMDISLADSNPTVRAFVAANFIPIGTVGADVDYGTSAVANPLTLRPNATTGGTTAAGTIENSNWIAPGGAITANSVQDSGLVRGTKIFLMAYNAPTLDSASQLGIFSATTWTLSTAAAVNTLSMALTQVDSAAEAYRGTQAPGALGLGAIVPEPSTSLMGLLAVLGLVVRRRR